MSGKVINRPTISDAEWQIMNVVWSEQPITAQQIIKHLEKSRDWTAATIRTFLHRLVKKGALKYQTEGNRYVYSTAITRHSTVKKASHSFLNSVFNGQTGPLIAHFVKNQRMSREEIAELRNILDAKDPQ